MTTDELRAWMKALEERDVRIVALGKRLALLELHVSELARQLQTKPIDAHKQAAAELFGIPPEQVTPMQRANAKALTFWERMPMGGLKRSADVRAAEAEADRLAGPELMSEYRAAACNCASDRCADCLNRKMGYVLPTFESSRAQALDTRLERANEAARHRGWRDIWQYASMRSEGRHSGSSLGLQVVEALAHMQEHGLPLDAVVAADLRRRGWLR